MEDISTQFNKSDSPANLPMSTDDKWERNTVNSPVYAVVSAVSDVEGTDPVELPPLYDSIDPEALNALFTSERESAVEKVSFRYVGYDVVVCGNGEVRVRPATES